MSTLLDERVEDQLETVADDEVRPPCNRPYDVLFNRSACYEHEHPADWGVTMSCGHLWYACDVAMNRVGSATQMICSKCDDALREIVSTFPL